MHRPIIQLSEITTELESGGRPSGGVNDLGDIFSIGGEHLADDGSFDFSSKKMIPFSFYKAMKRGKIKPHDILIVKDGATTGKTSYVSENFSRLPCAINEHVFRLAVDPLQANPHYVFYFLYSPFGNQQILHDFRGATVGGISQEFIEKVFLPLPPLEEQRRIADLLARADRLRRLRRYALQMSETFLQSVFLEMFGDPIINPKKWDVVVLEDYAFTTSGGTPDRNRPEYYNGTIPWVKSGELHTDLITITEEKITEIAINNSSAKIMPKGTIVIAMYGATAGEVSILGIDAATNQAICSIIPKVGLNTFYLVQLLKVINTYLLDRRIGGAQPNITQQIIRDLHIPLPPLNLQEEFKTMSNDFGKIFRKQTEAQRQAEGLFQALLGQVFGL